MIDKFFNNNYDKLLEVAKKYNKRYARELISNLYLHLERKYSDKSDVDLFYISIAYIKSEISWSNSVFNKVYNLKDNKSVSEDIIDQGVENNIYINSDDMTTFTSEYLKDLENDWNDLQIKKIISVNLYIKNLELHELILFDLWINKNLSYKKMSDRIGIPISSIRRMINDLKKKIKEGI